MPKPAASGNAATIALHFLDIQIAGQIWPQAFEAIRFKKAQAPLA